MRDDSLCGANTSLFQALPFNSVFERRKRRIFIRKDARKIWGLVELADPLLCLSRCSYPGDSILVQDGGMGRPPGAPGPPIGLPPGPGAPGGPGGPGGAAIVVRAEVSKKFSNRFIYLNLVFFYRNAKRSVFVHGRILSLNFN